MCVGRIVSADLVSLNFAWRIRKGLPTDGRATSMNSRRVTPTLKNGPT
jgi:hypothetical protein